MGERALARVDLGAVAHNCGRLKDALTGDAELCAVVKADGYGHGAVACAEAALSSGATSLAVATAAEAFSLRARLGPVPILVMGALRPEELDTALEAGSEIAVWREEFRSLVARRAEQGGMVARIHVKHDSGMGRLGNGDPGEVLALADACQADPSLELAGLWTHFATADDPDSAYFDEQLTRFEDTVGMVRSRHPDVTVHAANSAATLRDPRSHFDMVRCGIAIYGMDPFGSDPDKQGLRPALSLSSYVADVKRFAAGQSAGYGQTWRAGLQTWVGVVPIGYGDGVRRGLSNRGEVLIGGRRHPISGTVSMDNLTIDLGPETDVEVGAEVVLIGAQGAERILAEEVAGILETINYEVTCGISARVPRAQV